VPIIAKIQVTTEKEHEVAKQLAKLVGYKDDRDNTCKPFKTWGHITSGGTVANFEALWVARNLKYYPLAVKRAIKKGGLDLEVNITVPNKEEPEDLTSLDYWTLLNLDVAEVLSIREKLCHKYKDEHFRDIAEKVAEELNEELNSNFKIPVNCTTKDECFNKLYTGYKNVKRNKSEEEEEEEAKKEINTRIDKQVGRVIDDKIADYTISAKGIQGFFTNFEGYLSSIDAEFEDDLNNGILSEKLKDEFKTEVFSISENANVTKEKDDKWEITDGEKIYIVNKEDGKLNIYEGIKPGVILVTATAHYSLVKLTEALGIGKEQIKKIPIDKYFSMDIDELKKTLSNCLEEHEPIIALISILGSTEEGAVDYVHKITERRLHPKSQYLSRYIVHIIPCDGKQHHIEEHIR
jgi:hypothetical protein